jgi:hypothetical protein
MPKRFTVRVELHGAEDAPEIYGELHEAMQNHHFSRTIKINDVTYDLPSAEYTRFGDSLTGKQVLEDAKEAAYEVWDEFSVLVTPTTENRLQYNLKKAR